MTTVAEPSTKAALEEEALFREAKLRERRRRLLVLAAVLLAVVIGTSSYVIVRVATPGTPPVLSMPLLSRPLHLPPLGANGSCPTSRDRSSSNPLTGLGPYLGDGPVRLEIFNRQKLARSQVILGLPSGSSHWYGIDVIWLSLPSYRGAFVVRGASIGRPGRIDLRTANRPISGPLVVPAGNAGYGNQGDGYRALPSSVLVGTPGCYGLQVDGRGFSEVIVIDALRY